MFLPREKSLFVLVCVNLVLGVSLLLSTRAVADIIPYTPEDIVDDPFIFQHGPFHNSHNDPVPYGNENNTTDAGWIWNTGAYFEVDFGSPQKITSIRPYSVYPGSARGALWAVTHSDDGTNWSMDDGAEFDYKTCSQCGLTDAGDIEEAGGGYAGWYEYEFNLLANGHQYWKIEQVNITQGHAPRTGRLEFVSGEAYVPPTSFTWKANGSGDWMASTKSWSPAGAPVSGDQTATFGTHENVGGNTTAVINGTVQIGRVEFINANVNYAIAGTGSLDLTANSVGGQPSVDVQAGNHELQVRTNLQADTYLNVEMGQSLAFNHRLNLNGYTLIKTGDGNLAINNNLSTGTGGSLICEGGNCSGSGTVNGALVNGSTVSPGNSAGVLTVDGDYTQGGTATLAIELTGNGGVAGTDYDRLLVWGSANLDGTLDIQVDAGYTPTMGDSMPGIVTSANTVGTFATVNNVVFDGRRGVAVTYTETSVDATIALRGNTDVASGDVDVDTGDLTTSIINFTSAGGSGKTWAQGDMDGDGDVDTGDLTTSIINFTSAMSSGASAVPEPGSLMLLLLGMMALLVPGRRN